MKTHKPECPFSFENAPTLVVKIILFVWMVGVLFLFIIMFFPLEYVFSPNQFDIRDWMLKLRVWIQPFFSDWNINY